MKTDPFAKALAAASAGPIRRTMGSTPGGNPIPNWRHALVGALHRDSCDQLWADGYIAEDPHEAGAFHITEKGSQRLARLRAPERAWLS